MRIFLIILGGAFLLSPLVGISLAPLWSGDYTWSDVGFGWALAGGIIVLIAIGFLISAKALDR